MLSGYPSHLFQLWGPLLTQEPRGTGVKQAALHGVKHRVRQWDAVSHHSSIEPILGHQGAAAPAPLPLAPLSPSVLKPDLFEAEKRETEKYRQTDRDKK